jgi:hypothetical protein
MRSAADIPRRYQFDAPPHRRTMKTSRLRWLAPIEPAMSTTARNDAGITETAITHPKTTHRRLTKYVAAGMSASGFSHRSPTPANSRPSSQMFESTSFAAENIPPLN